MTNLTPLLALLLASACSHLRPAARYMASNPEPSVADKIRCELSFPSDATANRIVEIPLNECVEIEGSRSAGFEALRRSLVADERALKEECKRLRGDDKRYCNQRLNDLKNFQYEGWYRGLFESPDKKSARPQHLHRSLKLCHYLGEKLTEVPYENGFQSPSSENGWMEVLYSDSRVRYTFRNDVPLPAKVEGARYFNLAVMSQAVVADDYTNGRDIMFRMFATGESQAFQLLKRSLRDDAQERPIADAELKCE